jgi:hypothetical protein
VDVIRHYDGGIEFDALAIPNAGWLLVPGFSLSREVPAFSGSEGHEIGCGWNLQVREVASANIQVEAFPWIHDYAH